MAKSAITIKKNSVGDLRDKIRNASSNAAGVLGRDVYGLYQEHQAQRFASVPSNAGGMTSEDDDWPGLTSPTYKKYKPRRFASYPESGRRLMVATGSLAKVAVGRVRSIENPESEQTLYHRRMVSNTQLTVSISGEYAAPANELRPFMIFGDKFWNRVRDRIKTYFWWKK